MGQTQLRRAAWVLAVLTCFTVFGNHAAFASDGEPKLEAAGWFNIFNPPNNPTNNYMAEVKFGVTGKDDNGKKKGRFEYFDTYTGLKVHGKLTTLDFHSNLCVTPFGPPSTAPAVTVSGPCDEGTCSFTMDLVDGGDRKGNDYVCHVHVINNDQNHTGADDDDGANLVIRGNIKIKNY